MNSANVIPTANASMLVAIASSVTSLKENSSLISSSSPDKLSRIIFNPIAKSNTNPIIDANDVIMSDIVLMHHERFDGKGYPYGKKGTEIPFLARVCAIADAYDGMVSWKPYRDSLTGDEAVERMQAESGRQFQPELVECFVKCRKEIELIELAMNGE